MPNDIDEPFVISNIPTEVRLSEIGAVIAATGLDLKLGMRKPPAEQLARALSLLALSLCFVAKSAEQTLPDTITNVAGIWDLVGEELARWRRLDAN